MSDKRVTLEVVTPERLVYTAETPMVIAPGVVGQFGIMADHVPLVSALEIGSLTVKGEHEDEYEEIFINGGFFEVSENKAIVLTRSAESKEEIDLERAERAKQRAEERLSHPDADLDVRRAELALQRALMRLKIKS